MPELEEPIAKPPALSPEQQEDEYRNSVGVTAPVTAGDFASTALGGIAIPYGINRAIHGGKYLLSAGGRTAHSDTITKLGLRPEALKKLHEEWKKQKLSTAQRVVDLRSKAKPGAISPAKARRIVDKNWQKENPAPTLAGAAKNFIMPSLPGVAVNELLGLGAPFGDPKYKSGERGYLDSWWKSQQHKADRIGEKSREARERYGLAGVPLQMFHGLMNPVSSLLYGGTAIKDYFSGKQASLRVEHAEHSVRQALAQLTN